MLRTFGLIVLVIGLALLASFANAGAVWFFWTYIGLGETYFGFLPSAWHRPPFMDWWMLISLVVLFRMSLTTNYTKK